MKGHIIHFNKENKNGIIRGEDSKRYSFTSESVFYDGKINVGDETDFETDGTTAYDICLTSRKSAINFDVQKITNRLDTTSVIDQVKQIDVKNLPGVISALLIPVTLAFNLFNLKVMGMQMPVYADIDITNNMVITLIVILSVGSACLFGLGFNRRYLKIISLVMAAMFITLFISTIISVNEFNDARNATRDMLGSMGMEDYEVPKMISVTPALGYYFGVVGVLINLYFSFIHKNYNSKN